MNDLSRVNAVLIVFAMPGCGACEDYLPRLSKQVASFTKYGHPFVFHREGSNPKPGSIPICVFDTTSQDSTVQALADQHKITGMPTTILLTQRYGMRKFEGALEDQEIYDLLLACIHANR